MSCEYICPNCLSTWSYDELLEEADDDEDLVNMGYCPICLEDVD